MNLEKSFRPRKTQKARKFSKNYQAIDGINAVGTIPWVEQLPRTIPGTAKRCVNDRHLKSEWLYQHDILICFVFFVFFVDKLRQLG
jgi:hypothetical protein